MKTLLPSAARVLSLSVVAVSLSLPGTKTASAQTSCVTPPTNLNDWWRAEGDANDAIPGGANGVLVGNISFAPGQVGSAFVLDGSGDCVHLGNPTRLRRQDFTIEMWVKRSSPTAVSGSGDAMLFGYGTGGYGFGLLGNGRLFFSKVGIDSVTSTLSVSNTAWHHVAVTKSGSRLVFYVDGVSNSVTYLSTFTFGSNAAIGARGDTQANGFLGSLDEVTLYTRALTPPEVQSIYAAGTAGKCTGGVPPSILVHPVSQKVNQGTNVNLVVSATGTPNPSYQWRFNGADIAGATSTTLTIQSAQVSTQGVYSVRVFNSAGSAVSANATLTVNRLPVAADQSVALNEDTSAAVTVVGSDADGDLLTYSLVSGPAHGTLSGVLPNVTYVPHANYFGPDSFSFRVNDGMANSPAGVVSISVAPVNDAPVALSQSVSLNEDASLGVVLGAVDVDGDALQYSVTGPGHGTLSGVAPNLTYVPEPNFSGPDSFTFVVSDGLESSSATVSINVVWVNDLPVPHMLVGPLTEFPGTTNLVALAVDNVSVQLTLSAEGSSDVEGDILTYQWFDGTNALSNEEVTTHAFTVGTHEITLVASDPYDSAAIAGTVEVVGGAEAVAIIVDTVLDSNLKQKQPLMVSLDNALDAFDKDNLGAGINMLQAFQNKVRAQVEPKDPALAALLIAQAQALIDAFATQQQP